MSDISYDTQAERLDLGMGQAPDVHLCPKDQSELKYVIDTDEWHCPSCDYVTQFPHGGKPQTESCEPTNPVHPGTG